MYGFIGVNDFEFTIGLTFMIGDLAEFLAGVTPRLGFVVTVLIRGPF